MATLSEVVESIKQQNETLVDIKEFLAASLQEDVNARKAVERSTLKLEEDRREAKKVSAVTPTGLTAGVMQGLGITPVSNMIGSTVGGLFSAGGALAGVLAGKIGLGAGKLIKWGLIGSVIAAYFGDEIVTWLDPDGDGIANFGPIELDLNNPLIVAGLITAAGAVASAVTKFVGSLFVSLGAAGLALLFRKAGLTSLAGIMDRAARATSPLPGAGRAGPSTADAARDRAARLSGPPQPAVRMTIPQAQAYILQNSDKLPPNVKITPQGRLLRETPAGPRFVSPIAVAEQMIARPSAPVQFSGVRPAPSVPTGLPSSRVITSTALRSVGYALAPEMQLAADAAARAAASQSAVVAGAGRAALNVVRAVSSAPALAIQFAILPSNLADGTRVGYVAEPYNTMVNAMMEGKPINEILGHHKELKTRLNQHPDLRGYESLGDVANMTDDQIQSATSMLFAQTTGRIYTTRMSQGLGQATVAVGRVSSARLRGEQGQIKAGQETTTLDVLESSGQFKLNQSPPIIIDSRDQSTTTNNAVSNQSGRNNARTTPPARNPFDFYNRR